MSKKIYGPEALSDTNLSMYSYFNKTGMGLGVSIGFTGVQIDMCEVKEIIKVLSDWVDEYDSKKSILYSELSRDELDILFEHRIKNLEQLWADWKS